MHFSSHYVTGSGVIACVRSFHRPDVPADPRILHIACSPAEQSACPSACPFILQLDRLLCPRIGTRSGLDITKPNFKFLQEDEKQAKALSQQTQALQEVRKTMSSLATGLQQVQASLRDMHGQQGTVWHTRATSFYNELLTHPPTPYLFPYFLHSHSFHAIRSRAS
jgi:hypothetical protein